MIKKLSLILITLSLLFGSLFYLQQAVGKTLVFPEDGGTGTGEIPDHLDILVGSSTNDVYHVVSSSSFINQLDLSTGSSITSLNGLSTSTQLFATSTASDTYTITSSGDTHTFTIPSNVGFFSNDSGYLTSVDISDDTNLSAINPIVLTDDQLSFSSSSDFNWTGNHSFAGYIDLLEMAEPSSPTNAGRLFAFDQNGETRVRFVDPDGVVSDIVQDNTFVVRNTSGVAMDKGDIVYVTDQTGQVPEVGLAKSDSTTTLPAVAVLNEDVSDNGYGTGIKVGVVEDIDTSAFSVGDDVYVSATTAGGFTNTRPPHPHLNQPVGRVLASGVGNGSIKVNIEFPQGDELGTRENIFKIGDNTDGVKTLTFDEDTADGSINWNGSSYFLNDGNVGIGTSTPATTLHVIGTSTMDNLDDVNTIYFADESGDGSIFSLNENTSSGDLQISRDGSDIIEFDTTGGLTTFGNIKTKSNKITWGDGSEIFENASSNLVLSSVGKVAVTDGNMEVSGRSSSTDVFVSNKATTTNLAISSLANGFLNVDANGQVGTSTVDVSDDLNLTATNPITLTGDDLGFASSSDFNWTGTHDFNTTTTLATGSGFVGIGTTTKAFDDILNVDGRATFQEGINVNQAQLDSNISFGFDGGSNALVIDGSSGFVGIGDILPDARLEVATLGSSDAFMFSDGSTGDGDLFIIENDGDVGISNNTPSTLFDINSNFLVDSTGKATSTDLAITNLTNCDTIDTDASGVLSCGTDDAGSGGGGISSTTPFSAGYIPQATSSNSITNSNIFQSGSDVGIGTSTPAFQLHVDSGTTGANSQFVADNLGSDAHIDIFNEATASTSNLSAIRFSENTDTQKRLSSIIASSFSTTTDANRKGLLQFRVANTAGPVNRMVIDGPNVGIGTDSPTHELHLEDTGNTTTFKVSDGTSNGFFQAGVAGQEVRFILDNNATGGDRWDLRSGDDGDFSLLHQDTTTEVITVNPDAKTQFDGDIALNNEGDAILFNDNSGTQIQRRDSTAYRVNSMEYVGISDSIHIFDSSDNGFGDFIIGKGGETSDGANFEEFFRIDNAGDVGIDTNNPVKELHTVGGSCLQTSEDGTSCSNAVEALYVQRPNVDAPVVAWEDNDGRCNGNPESGSFVVSCSSDQSLKENIRDATSTLDILMDYRLRNYEMKSNGQTKLGVVAQELEQKMPDKVTEQNGTKYVELPSKWELLKGMQEQQEIIEDLRSRIEKLEK